MITSQWPQYMPTVIVELACNDDSGNFAGELYALNIDNIIMIANEMDPLKIDFVEGKLKSKGKCYPIYSYRYWVGNMAWDAVRMSIGDTVRLLEQLRDAGWGWDTAAIGLGSAWDKGWDINYAFMTAWEALRPDAKPGPACIECGATRCVLEWCAVYLPLINAMGNWGLRCERCKEVYRRQYARPKRHWSLRIGA